MNKTVKVAIVHYWFTTWRGGEKVIDQLLDIFPDADIYTHVVDPKIQKEHLAGKTVKTTFINKLPLSTKFYQKYLPLMFFALEQLDLTDYDLIISSESGPAKNIITNPESTHICYCHSPMRYVWDMYYLYMAEAGFITKLLMKPLIHYLKIVDRLSADRVDHFISNSHFIRSRIQKYYRRDSTVINPPVDVDAFTVAKQKKNFYLCFGQLTPYKKVSIVVDSFVNSERELIVIGEGEEFDYISKVATPNIKVLGRQPDSIVRQHLSEAKALIFPGVEDFGIVPVEAMASGTPVIAYGFGGVLDSVTDGETGLFFYEQTKTAIMETIKKFEASSQNFDPKTIRARAMKFSNENFKNNLTTLVEKLIPMD